MIDKIRDEECEIRNVFLFFFFWMEDFDRDKKFLSEARVLIRLLIR